MATPEPKKTEDFWKTPKGISLRVDSLVQVFSYKVVNNALRVIAPINGAKWMRWVLHPERSESGPCEQCIGYAKGGRNGNYRITWFLPEMPAHPRCVCEWEIFFEAPDIGTDEDERARQLLVDPLLRMGNPR